MSLLVQYIAVLLLSSASKDKSEEIAGSFKNIVSHFENEFGIDLTENDIRAAFEILAPFAASEKDYNPLTDGYWVINYDNFKYYFVEDDPDYNDDKDQYAAIKKLTDNYPVLQAYGRRGYRYAEEVLQALVGMNSDQVEQFRSSDDRDQVPASDRLVRIDHNQSSEIEKKVAEIVDYVEDQNQIDAEEGLRELILGQLKSGLELIRAGCFKVYAIEVTLLEGLKFLAKRYERETIGALAAALIAALSQQFGLAV